MTSLPVNDYIELKLNAGKGMEDIISDIRREIITTVLDETGFNVSRASIKLKCHRNTLIRWIRELGIKRNRK